MLFIRTDKDFYISLEKALDEIDGEWRSYNGVLVAGSHAPTDVEAKLFAIKEARVNNTPFLGICLGAQLAWIEYARNVLGIKDATSEEIGEGTHIVKKLSKLRVGLYAVDGRQESHWHNFTFNNEYTDRFMKDWDMTVTGAVLEAANLKGHPFFWTTQFHAEYGSSALRPHPLLVEFISKCKENAKRI